MKKILITMLAFILFTLTGCTEPEPTSVKTYGTWNNENLTLDDINLDWENSRFTHNGNTILINDSEYDDKNDLDKHDLIYQYKWRVNTLYNGDTVKEVEFRDLDHEYPEESVKHITISNVNVDFASKIKNRDEFLDDYFFLYDFQTEFLNSVYIRISKDDIDKIIDENYDEIQVDCDIAEHIDGTISILIDEDESMENVGLCDNLHIYNNAN